VNVIAAQAGTTDGADPDSGTSMAAPHVAGAIALVFSRSVAGKQEWATGNMITTALRQMTRDYNGRHDSGEGYGVPDISKVLGAY
jgi:subtilisin family serine protease